MEIKTEESRKWGKREEKSAKSFLRKKVFQDNYVTPFLSSINRHLSDGNRTLTNPEEIKQQTADQKFFTYITKIKIIRPERGDTNVSTREEEGVLYYHSAVTRIFKDIFRGTRTASKLDYHTAQRFAAPIIIDGICLYVHMECVPFRMLDGKGNVIDPRIKKTIKGAEKPYNVDSRFVLTIGWPERKEAPFLNKIIGASPYPEGVIVNGRISWKDFIQNELFSDILKKLKIDVTNEKPEKHPTIVMGAFFTELNFVDCILPSSPVDNGHSEMPPFTF
jgi:hypothetical protein